MKKKLLYSLWAAFLLVGCMEKYNEQTGLYPSLIPRWLAVSKTNVEFSAETGSENIRVTSLQTPWKIENAIDWVTLSKMSGEADASVAVRVSENEKVEGARVGIFYLKSDVEGWRYESPVSVTQVGAVPSISLSATSLEFSGAANSQTVAIEANCEYGVSSTETWLTAVVTGNGVNISVLPNETRDYRNGVVTVVSQGNSRVSKNISVHQAPATIQASTETLEVDNTVVEVEISITSECDWTAGSSDSWIEVSPSAGNAGTSVMRVSIAPNPSIIERNGYVLVYTGKNESIRIPVRQKGIFVEVEENQLDFAAGGGTKTLKVSSNTSWEVSYCPDWVAVEPASGNGSGTINVTAEENPYTSNRSGRIEIRQAWLGLSFGVDVSQAGKIFEVGANVLNFEDKAATQSIYIKSDGTWTAETSNGWISVSPATFTGSDSLRVSVTENAGGIERQGVIFVRVSGKSVIIHVVQQGKYFTVENSALSFTSKGGNLAISVSTNEAWTAKVENEASWLELSAASGEGTADIIATAADNPSVNSRTAYIVIETVNHRDARIKVTQQARYLTVDTREVLFYAAGGTSQPIMISTDGVYKVTASDTWFSVSESNNQITVVASRNEGNDPRIGTVMLELTDLEEGTYKLTLTVTQLNYGGTFLRYDYDEDENYDGNEISNGNLILVGYGDDNDFDNTLSSGASLRITGYRSDSNWDSTEGSSAMVTITGYSPDRRYDSPRK